MACCSPIINIYLNFSHVLVFLWNFVRGSEEKFVVRDIAAKFLRCSGNRKSIISCLSVRSAMDLYLQVKAYPPGSEIICSAINIPDMEMIMNNHGLVPVPVDISKETLSMSLSDVKKAFNSKTKAMLITHLFGLVYDQDEIIRFAKENRIDIIEDAAQCFTTLAYSGHPGSTISFFSFGIIKKETALGGGLAVVNGEESYLTSRMRDIQSQYPIQPKMKYFMRVITCYIVSMMQYRSVVLFKWLLLRYFQINFDTFVAQQLRGFKPDSGQPFRRYRYRPCLPLLRNILFRLEAFNEERSDQVAKRIRKFTSRVAELGIKVPGGNAEARHFWLYPIFLRELEQILKSREYLLRQGVMVSTCSTQLTVIAHPRKDTLTNARDIIQRVLFFPVNQMTKEQDFLLIEDSLKHLA